MVNRPFRSQAASKQADWLYLAWPPRKENGQRNSGKSWSRAPSQIWAVGPRQSTARLETTSREDGASRRVRWPHRRRADNFFASSRAGWRRIGDLVRRALRLHRRRPAAVELGGLLRQHPVRRALRLPRYPLSSSIRARGTPPQERSSRRCRRWSTSPISFSRFRFDDGLGRAGRPTMMPMSGSAWWGRRRSSAAREGVIDNDGRIPQH